jgi:GntR family transcriptional regulator
MHTDMQPLLTALHVENSGVPIYVQLREQLLSLIGAGRLMPGDQMPTMRQVAVALRVDLNTVRRAYDELEALGALSISRGVGTFVAAHPQTRAGSAEAVRVASLAQQTVALAKSMGIDPVEVARRILQILEAKEDRS